MLCDRKGSADAKSLKTVAQRMQYKMKVAFSVRKVKINGIRTCDYPFGEKFLIVFLAQPHI